MASNTLRRVVSISGSQIVDGKAVLKLNPQSEANHVTSNLGLDSNGESRGGYGLLTRCDKRFIHRSTD